MNKESVNWNQVRIDTAINVMNAILSSSIMVFIFQFVFKKQIADIAVSYANKLVEELKKMNIFSKFLNWFKVSNRWKHLICGVLIGVGANSIYCAVYTGIGIASALELKDRLWGGKIDLIDWVLTVIGVAIGYLIRFGIISILL